MNRVTVLSRCSLLLIASVGALSAFFGCRDRDREQQERTGTFERDRPALSERDRNLDPSNQDKAGVTTLTGASWVSNNMAIDRIVSSRCAREISCSSIGPDKRFTTGEVCTTEVRKQLSEDLKTSECPSGVDGKNLDQCLDAIRSESCTNPIDTIGRLAACRTSDLCLKVEMPHR